MKKIVLLVLTGIGLSSCSVPIPKCSDNKATTLVKQIVDKEMVNQLGKEKATEFSYDVSFIRTIDIHDKTGAFECSAELEIHNISNQSNTIPITYTIELTDDKKEFYVNVYGLR